MKPSIFLLSILLSITSLAQRPDVKIGMSMDDFRKTLPDIVPDKLTFNETIHEKVTSNGCAGHWSYHFREDQMDEAAYWTSSGGLAIGYSNYDPEVVTSEFKRLNDVTDILLKDYAEKYGKPHQAVVSNPEFIDPAENGESHDIKIYSWTFDNVLIKLTYGFQGHAKPGAEQYVMNAPPTTYQYSINIAHHKVDHAKELKVPTANENMPFQLGMKVSDFAKKRKDLFPKGVHCDGYYRLDSDWKGLKGDWNFSFDESKLSGISFSAYSRDEEGVEHLSEENFNRFLAGTRQMIADYTELKGKPKSLTEGTLKYKDPASHKHYGYDVLEAEWKDGTEIYFKFHGGKAQYYFSVQVMEK